MDIRSLKNEVMPEVKAFGFFVVDELLGRARADDATFADDVAAVDDRENLAGVVVGDKDADILFGEDLDKVFDFLDGDRVDVGEGLVEEKEVGLGDEGAGDLKAAPFAAGEARGDLFGEVREMKLVEKLVELIAPLLRGQGHALENGEDVIFNREVTEDRGFLGKVAHPHLSTLVHRIMGDRSAVEHDVTFIGADEACRDIESGRFARPIGAEKPDDLSTFYMKREAIDHFTPPITLLKVFYVEAHLTHASHPVN